MDITIQQPTTTPIVANLPAEFICNTPEQFVAALKQIEDGGGVMVEGGGGVDPDTPNGEYSGVVTVTTSIAQAAEPAANGAPRYYCRSTSKVDFKAKGEKDVMVLHPKTKFYKAGEPVKTIVKDATGKRRKDYPKAIQYAS